MDLPNNGIHFSFMIAHLSAIALQTHSGHQSTCWSTHNNHFFTPHLGEIISPESEVLASLLIGEEQEYDKLETTWLCLEQCMLKIIQDSNELFWKYLSRIGFLP